MRGRLDSSSPGESDKERDSRRTERERSSSLRIITSTPDATRPNSPVHEVAKLSAKVLRDSSKQLRAGSDFDISSGSSLNEIEIYHDKNKAERRINKLNHERSIFSIRSQSLYDQDFTDAMHIVDTCVSAAKIIGNIVDFIKTRQTPQYRELLTRFEGKPLIDLATHYADDMNKREGVTWHTDLIKHAVRLYNDTKDKILKPTKMMAGQHMNPPSENDLLLNPATNPVDQYEGKRRRLMREIDKHNDDNDVYNGDRPHLKKHKLDRFDYPKQLHAQVTHLPSLNEALEQKIWERHEEILRNHPLARPGYELQVIQHELSKHPVTWVWHQEDQEYQLRPIVDESGEEWSGLVSKDGIIRW